MDIASKLTDFDHGVTAIDTDYVRPRLDASHLIVDDGHAAFVDTGTTLSVPNLLAGLAAKGLDAAQVDYVLTTHVHLDHAGGAGELMRHLPKARCVIHPRGARHLVEPDKLVAGSIVVYGEQRFRSMYGEVVPIPESRVLVAQDGDRLTLGRRTLELIHTPGHALHHYCIVDHSHRGIFSGDTFGMSYRELDVDGREFIFPTTTPVHFDPDALIASIDRLMGYSPSCVYLTHYSRVTDVERLSRDLKQRIAEFVRLGRRLAGAEHRRERLTEEMFTLLSVWLDEHGYTGDRARRHEILDDDIDLNVQGLEVWLNRT